MTVEKNLILSKVKLLTNTRLAILIIFLITSVYLFPIFFGKVDTALDIRNVRMYPWRYYSVDKKINLIKLWEGRFSSPVFNLVTPPSSSRMALFKMNLNEIALSKLSKLSDSNYYIDFDFKSEYDKSVAFDFGIKLVNKVTGEAFTPGVAVVPIDEKNTLNPWYKANFPLNNLIAKLRSVADLNQFELQIITKNKSSKSLASLYLKDLQFVCEDFSQIAKVHNHYNNDLIQMFTPFREYFSNSLKRGKLPFWNNQFLTGAEFLAEPQVGYFHPLNFLFYLIFDHFTAHSLITFFCLALCGIGAFLLATYWGLAFGPSLLCAVVYMFQPFNVTWLSYGHMIMNCATLPFLLLAYEKNLNEKKILNKYLLSSAILLGLIFLSGHLQYIHYTSIFFFLFTIFRFAVEMFSKDRNYIKHIVSIIFTFSIGIMVGSVVIIPFLSLFHNSHRVGNPDGFIRNTSIPLEAFKGLFYPYYKGYPEWPISGLVNRTLDYQNYKLGFFRNYVYFGLLPFLFSIFTLGKVFKNKLISFFYLAILFSLLMCTGSPLFFLMRGFVPGFKEMQHYRLIMLYSYCVPFLSAFGFQIFLSYLSQHRQKLKNIIIFLVVLISAIDLMFYSSYFITWSDRKDFKPIPQGSSLEFLLKEKKKSKEPFRVLPFVSHKIEGTLLKPDIAEPNTLWSYGLEDVSGYSSFIPKDIYYIFFYIQTMDASKLYSGEIFDLFSNINTPYPISNFHSKILDLLNVKYFFVPNFLTIESDKVKKVFSNDCTIYENKHYLPRAFVVPDCKVIESSKDTIVELDSENFNPREQAILMILPLSLPPRNDNINMLEYKIDFVKYEPNNIILKANVNGPSFFILGHNLNDNWKVKINGKEDKHFQANLVQRAIYLSSAGEYLIEFYYFPKLFLIGFSIMLLGLFVILFLAIHLKLKKDKVKM